MFRTVLVSIISSFFTVHTAKMYVIQFASRIRTEMTLLATCQQTFMTYTIAVCTVKNS